MGTIVVSEFVSLDGVMEDPGGAESYRHGGWSFTFDRSSEGDRFKMDELTAAEAMLLGRTTYEGFAAAWPSMEDPDGFAGKMNAMPKYVVSSTLRSADWNNSTILPGDPLEEITALKERVGGNILVGGSARLVHLLAEHDLVDEYRLMVFPVLLGSGKRVFPDSDSESTTRLRLASSERAGDVQMLVLHRER
ncbi:MAG: dihydrofolate reductase family protein [Mycobacteriales bacterium]